MAAHGELQTLAALLAEYFRDLAVPLVIASQAGLETTLIAHHDTVADLWWAVVEQAAAEGRLRALVEVAASRVGNRRAALDAALAAYDTAEARAAEPALLPLPQPMIGGAPLRRPVRARRGMSDQEWHELATAVALIQQRQEMMIAEMEALHATVNTVMWIYGGGLLLLVIGMLVHVLV